MQRVMKRRKESKDQNKQRRNRNKEEGNTG